MIASATLTGTDVIPVAFAISAAHQHGLLAALAEQPADVETLATTLRLDARAVSLVLDLLHRFGVVERLGGARFALAPLLRDAAGATPGGLAADRHLWSRLNGFLADGVPVIEIDGGNQARAPFYAGIVAGLGTLWAEAAQRLAGRLAGHGPRVLDVGCGSGVWSLALASRRTDCAVTGVDLEPVLPSFLARAATLGLGDRVRAVAGDAHQVPLGSDGDGAGDDFDVAIVANLLRLEDPQRAAALVARVARAVRPGGQLVVVDALAEGSTIAERNRAIYALHLGMRTRAGRVHPRAVIARWMEQAGLGQAEVLDLGDVPGAVAGLRAWRSA